MGYEIIKRISISRSAHRKRHTMVIIANSSGSGRGEFPCRIRILGQPRANAIREYP
jgi:hypothetical protein